MIHSDITSPYSAGDCPAPPGPPPRFAQDEPLTLITSATADAEYDLTPGLPFATVRLAGPPAFFLDVPLGGPDVTVLRGDVRGLLLQMAEDAIAHHDDGKCGYPEHAGLSAVYVRVRDELAAQVRAPALSGRLGTAYPR